MTYDATLWAIRFVWLFCLIPAVIAFCIWRNPVRDEIGTDELRKD